MTDDARKGKDRTLHTPQYLFLAPNAKPMLKFSKREEKETILYRKNNLLSLSTSLLKIHLDALFLECCGDRYSLKHPVWGLCSKVSVAGGFTEVASGKR